MVDLAACWLHVICPFAPLSYNFSFIIYCPIISYHFGPNVTLFLSLSHAGKLPPPRSMNSVLQEYPGPVLIAQGALDPLNDAVARARQFSLIRPGVHATLMQLGHCPHDEDGAQVAECVMLWAIKEDIIRSSRSSSGGGVSTTPSLSAISMSMSPAT